MTSFQLYADGLQIVSSMLFEKHSTFQSLDLLNGFTCHTLGFIKKEGEKIFGTQEPSFSFILIADVLLLLHLRTKIYFSLTTLARKKTLKIYIYVSCFYSCSRLISKFLLNYLHKTDITWLPRQNLSLPGLYCALVFSNKCLLACSKEKRISLLIWSLLLVTSLIIWREDRELLFNTPSSRRKISHHLRTHYGCTLNFRLI